MYMMWENVLRVAESLRLRYLFVARSASWAQKNE